MKHTWIKRFTAWLLSALLLISPALAEAAEPETFPELAAEIVEAAVTEADPFELGGEADDEEPAGAALPGEATFDLPESGEDAVGTLPAGDAPEASDWESPDAPAAGGDVTSDGESDDATAEEVPQATDAETVEIPVEAVPEGDADEERVEAEGAPAEAAPSDGAEDLAGGEDRETSADNDGEEAPDDAESETQVESSEEAGDETQEESPDKGENGTEKEAPDAADSDKAASPDEAGGKDGDEAGDAVKDEAEDAVKAELTPEPAAVSAEAQAAPTAAPEVSATEEPAAPKQEAEAAEEAPAPILPAELQLGKGEKRLLTPAVDLSAELVTWTSSKPGTVSVSQKGKLTAKRRGSAVVTMTTGSGLTASCLVRVYKAPSKVTVKPGKKLSMGLGEVRELTGKLPAGTSSALSWSSSAPGVAAVDAQGRVTALAPGKAKIRVKTFNGKKAVCTVKVLAAPSAVAFSVGDQVLGVGQTADLKPVVNPGAAANVALSSDNPGAAVVSGSTVTAVAPGSAVITGTTYNGLAAALTVTVLPAPSAVGLAYAKLYVGVGEKVALEPATDPGTATAFKFKSAGKKTASVSASGTVKGRRTGTTTVTVTTHNGLKAKVKIVVRKAPSKVTLKPKSLAMEIGSTYQLTATLPKKTASAITFTSSNPEVVAVDAAGLLTAVSPGSATITARTFNNKKATCKVTAGAFSGVGAGSYGALSLSSSGMVMLRVGASWNLSAISATGSLDGISWSTTSSSIAKIVTSGGACTVKAAGKGTAIVTARLPDGSYASVIFMVVDVTDLSASNFNAVQKALLNHEELINSEAGGNVIWDMIAGRMLKANYKQDQVNDLIARLKAADATYRNLYIYSFGTYTQSAERTGLSASYFDQASNTLYLKKSSLYSGSDYAYVVFHESGHAIDWNADGNSALNSLNADATAAVLADVRSLLAGRVAAAVANSGVSAASVNTDKVVDMLMNYRVLTDPSLLNGLNDAERVVYTQLSNAVAGEMNNALPTNNGCMVWDSVEGATNYAVHGKFGHYYLLADGSDYKAEATYYFWNLKGEPQITTEPWAEFFSANVMGDSGTLSLNWSYLPQTCKYFAETLVPQMLSYFMNRVRNS